MVLPTGDVFFLRAHSAVLMPPPAVGVPHGPPDGAVSIPVTHSPSSSAGWADQGAHGVMVASNASLGLVDPPGTVMLLDEERYRPPTCVGGQESCAPL